MSNGAVDESSIEGLTSSSQRGKTASVDHHRFTDEWSFLNDMDNIPALNLRVLNRHNSNITSLIDKSSYCVVYTFSTANASWTKAGYEGTLFIYSQRPHMVQTPTGEQRGGLYGFCVLNRLSLENFWGEIDGGDIVLDDQYIITRSLTGGSVSLYPSIIVEIYGLWLYEIDDRPRIFNIFNEYHPLPLPWLT